MFLQEVKEHVSGKQQRRSASGKCILYSTASLQRELKKHKSYFTGVGPKGLTGKTELVKQ